MEVIRVRLAPPRTVSLTSLLLRRHHLGKLSRAHLERLVRGGADGVRVMGSRSASFEERAGRGLGADVEERRSSPRSTACAASSVPPSPEELPNRCTRS